MILLLAHDVLDHHHQPIPSSFLSDFNKLFTGSTILHAHLTYCIIHNDLEEMTSSEKGLSDDVNIFYKIQNKNTKCHHDIRQEANFY